jgi:predicted 2-oxoglutarate/Fe(II)-dependent dioxygenase YbiX
MAQMAKLITDNDIKITIDPSYYNEIIYQDINTFMKTVILPDNNKYCERAQSTCHVNKVATVDTTKRNSQTYKYKFGIKSAVVDEWLKGEKILPLNMSRGFGSFLTTFELIKYEAGGVFQKHTDTFRGGNHKDEPYLHTHMILLYPPGTVTTYTGGDLIIYGGCGCECGCENGEMRITSDTLDNWTFVIFSQQTAHEVTPVISGERFVFKAALYTYNPNYEPPEEMLED